MGGSKDFEFLNHIQDTKWYMVRVSVRPEAVSIYVNGPVMLYKGGVFIRNFHIGSQDLQ